MAEKMKEGKNVTPPPRPNTGTIIGHVNDGKTVTPPPGRPIGPKK